MIKLKKHIILIFWLAMTEFFVICSTSAQFTIGPGGFVTLKEGGSLMIGTDFHIKSIAGSSGHFADQTVDGDVTITGDIVVERYLAPDTWHNVASPVSNETSDCFTTTDLVFWYDESMVWNDWNFGWVWYYGATGGPLMVFRGYDVLIYSLPETVNYTATGAETLNTGAYNYNVIITDPAPNPEEIPSHTGWNLAGNPYPSPVDWLTDMGWDKSDINDAKYIWDGANDIYTIFLGGGSPIGINGGTRFIPSNQGFWVQAFQNGSISVNNSVRLGSMTGTPDFYKLAPVDYPLVSLISSGNERCDEVIVRFIEGSTTGFDLNLDATKLFSFKEEVPQLSIKSGKQVLALNTLPEICDDLSVLLNFQCGKPGFYRINFSPKCNLEPSVQVYLKDELENKMINLRKDSVYGFAHDPSNDKNRFRIWFNPSEDLINNVTPGSYFSVYPDRNTINIIKNTTIDVSGDIIVYNMLGQPVHREKLKNEEKSVIRLNATTGYYIVSIITAQQITNSKILINKF